MKSRKGHKLSGGTELLLAAAPSTNVGRASAGRSGMDGQEATPSGGGGKWVHVPN